MNRHKFFHRVGFAVITGLSLGIIVYLASVSIIMPLLTYPTSSSSDNIYVGLSAGGFFWFVATSLCLFIGTPWDDDLTIKENRK